MNALEEALAVLNDEEIVQLYKKFKKEKEHLVACRLRTAFIQHKLYQCTNIDWSGAIKYFIEEETRELRRNPVMLNSFLTGNTSTRSILTNINPLLHAKLRKEGLNELKDVEIIAHLSKQNPLMYNPFFVALFRLATLKHYVGSSTNFHANELLTKVGIRHDNLLELGERHRENLSCDHIDLKITDLFQEVQNYNDIKEHKYEYVREQLRAMFIGSS